MDRPVKATGRTRGETRTDPDVPATRALRDAAREAAEAYVRDRELLPPAELSDLRNGARKIAAELDLPDSCEKWLVVILSNALWRDAVSQVPFDRRLLLAPQCLRDPSGCAGRIDELGLLCARCGRCVLNDLLTEAETLGYATLVAEGSAAVMALIETGQIEAVVGVSCLEALEKVFPYMEAAAAPGVAIPLLRSGCENTALDVDWLIEVLYSSTEGDSLRMDIDALRRRVETWFTPAGLAEGLGEPQTVTERLGQQWLALSGKRWRPFLLACAYRAFAGEAAAEEPMRRLAVAVECFHKASLIHDDIEDDDATRYGRETLHQSHGVPIALNVGDFLLGEGYRMIAESGAAPENLPRMLHIAVEGHRNLTLGQGDELDWARRNRPLGIAEAVDIFRRKTAPAFEVALRLGAAACGADARVRDALKAYSDALGIAYQIRDDLDDLLGAGDPADLLAGRPNCLPALGWELAGQEDRRLFERLWSGGEQVVDVDALRAALDRCGAVAAAGELLNEHKRRAVIALAELPSVPLRALLRRVVSKIFGDLPALECCAELRAVRDGGTPVE